MIKLQDGNYPQVKIDRKDLPLTAADLGQSFEFNGTARLTGIKPEGPTYTLELLEVEFPGREQGTVKSRRDKRNKASAPLTININAGG